MQPSVHINQTQKYPKKGIKQVLNRYEAEKENVQLAGFGGKQSETSAQKEAAEFDAADASE